MTTTPAAPEPGAGDALPLMSELVTAPSFRIGFRGYDPRQVDRYTQLMEAQLEAGKVAQRELAADVRSLSEQLDRAHEELAVLRRRPTVDDTISFRHLGPRVEQILADAHAEAEAIVDASNRSAQELRERTEEKLRTTREQQARAVSEFESHRRWLHEEEARWTRLLHARKDAVARADEYRRRVRREAEELLEAATAQHERLVASALARTEQMLAQASNQAAAIREAARRAAIADQQAAFAARDAAVAERDTALAQREDLQQSRPDDQRAPAGTEPDRAMAERARDEAAAADEAVGSAELAAPGPAVGTASVDTSGAEAGAEEPARGVAKVVYVVSPGETGSGEPEAGPEAEGIGAPVRKSTVDAR